jgi:hypothetical protein
MGFPRNQNALVTVSVTTTIVYIGIEHTKVLFIGNRAPHESFTTTEPNETEVQYRTFQFEIFH